ncbi:MAG: DUF2892 domain-containing protein [Alphaproteobacteria bacterium]|nr:DUF2892 domain-containing protein [Alphaproteobacteria bacterium]
MKCNVGTSDRILRITAGLLILGAGVYFQTWAGLVGLVPLATGIFRFCPAYVPLKINTTAKS